MLLNGQVVVWFGGLVVFGFVGLLFFGLLVMIRVITTTFRSEHGIRAGDHGDQGRQIHCSRKECGHLNPGHARFCGRCGKRLNLFDVDTYG